MIEFIALDRWPAYVRSASGLGSFWQSLRAHTFTELLTDAHHVLSQVSESHLIHPPH